jgi:UDP-N-acetylglucosamine/UDP-N-acetylgalactosamine diphosphorylase
MASEGIDTLSYFQVDNPLVRCIDPAFIGWHLTRGSEMSSKTVPKAYPEEKLGHFCIRRGELVVIEYSDLPLALQRERDPATGALRYEAGSIAIHVFNREFIRRMARDAGGLPFHRADKKVATVDAEGRGVRPEKANGVKFELFVFDALPSARRPVIVETSRADDFSPVKNAEGVDSPATCRADQLRQFARWLRSAGAFVPTDSTGLPGASLEVSPLFGYDEESFAESWARLAVKPAIADGLCLEAPPL